MGKTKFLLVYVQNKLEIANHLFANRFKISEHIQQ